MRLTPFTEENYQGIYAFMAPLWKDTYKAILPREQIDLLLQKYFSAQGLAHYRSMGYQYYVIESESGEQTGVLVYQHREEGIYIDKLYVLPAFRGKGYPAFVFNELQKSGEVLFLNVNQKNARAVHCYLKNGFVIAKEERIELGQGMVNVDYVMRKEPPVKNL